MATFNYTVDTQPMAAEIGSVSRHVKATATAVVAMQAAVVLAEEKAATHICENANKGFYAMMRSQISQKIAKLRSDVDSHAMKLHQLRKSLLSIRTRMERDYNMISVRYLKLFNGLNVNLKQRIFELDKPVMNFVVKEVERVSNRTKYLTATVPVAQLESLSASQKIVASNMKYRGLNVINSMQKFLGDVYLQKKLATRILQDSHHAEAATLAIPVIISETCYDSYDTKSIEVTTGCDGLSRQAQAAIRDKVIANADNVQWQETEISRAVKSEFSKMLAESSASQRVKALAEKLFLGHRYQTIQIQQP